MTDEERERAEKLAVLHSFSDFGRMLIKEGYEAACEDKRAEIEVERARATKLIECLKHYAPMETVVAPDGRHWPLGLLAQRAIAEYEASK